MATTSSAPATGRTRTRRARVPGRGQLLGATIMVLVGSFMPWVYTALGSVSGARGAGLWTFYAGVLGLAGTLIPHRLTAVIHATILSVACVAIIAWQVIHLLTQIGTEGWAPGPGLVLVLGGGILAGVAARNLWRSRG
ncbi:MAG: hypothetical protein Q8Q02_10430 [Nocardioides sp.]|nr:hypothetical protein [Nocardioides sp.]